MCSRIIYTLFIFCCLNHAISQTIGITGKVASNGQVVANAMVLIKPLNKQVLTDSNGMFQVFLPQKEKYTFHISHLAYQHLSTTIRLINDTSLVFDMIPNMDMLDDIVLLGNSKKLSAKTVPLSVSILKADAILKTVETNMVDAVSKHVMGLSTVKTGPNLSKPFIRGLGYNRVLTLIDGMRQEGQQWGDEHGIELNGYQVSKVEVIKGPASLIYGSDALAGVIHFITDEPIGQTQPSQQVISISEFQTNHKLIGNSVSWRKTQQQHQWLVHGSYKLAGNYKNRIDGPVYLTNFNEYTLGINYSFNTKKGSWKTFFSAYSGTQGIPDGSRDSVTRQFTKQVEQSNNDVITNRPIVSNSELNSYQVPSLAQKINHKKWSLSYTQSIRQGEIEAFVGVQQNHRQEFIHPKYPNMAGLNLWLTTACYSFKLIKRSKNMIEHISGVNGLVQQNSFGAATEFTIPNYVMYDAGIYHVVKIKKEAWAILAGARVDNRWIQADELYLKKNLNNYFDEPVLPTAAGNVEKRFTAFNKHFVGWSASLGATYAASKQLTFKANVGSGFRAPNINELASNGLDPGARIVYKGNTQFASEQSWQVDVGFVFTSHKVHAELALFRNYISQFIYQQLVVDDVGNPIIDNQGNKTFAYKQAMAELLGGEYKLKLHALTPYLSLQHQGAYVLGFNRDKAYVGKKQMGEYLPLIAPFTCQTTLQLNLQKLWQTKMPIAVDVEHVLEAAQNRYLAINNSETATPSYQLCNANVNATIAVSKHQTVQCIIGVTNLFDMVYQSHLSRLKYMEHYANSPNGASGLYNMGRNFTFKCIVTWW